MECYTIGSPSHLILALIGDGVKGCYGYESPKKLKFGICAYPAGLAATRRCLRFVVVKLSAITENLRIFAVWPKAATYDSLDSSILCIFSSFGPLSRIVPYS